MATPQEEKLGVSDSKFNWKLSINKKIYFIIFLLAGLISLYFRLKGWNGSLIEMHSFRQTQTAITVQYLLKGGDLLRYQTPVLGPPWAIPFEFPFFQYIVSLIVKLTGYGIDQCGRLVSLLFFFSIMYPFYFLSKPYFADRSRTFIALALLCISPQYIFWSRTFMIESTALSLSVWYLYFIDRYLDAENPGCGSPFLLGMVLFTGVVASITKVTTFFVYYIVAMLFLLLWTVKRDGIPFKGLLKKKALLVVSAVLPLIAIIAWTRYSDHIKSLNVFGAGLTSGSLKAWNFGTWEQKVSLKIWTSIFQKSLADIFGDVRIFFAALLLLPFCRRRTILVSLLLILLFLLPIAVFTNLYYAHNYYCFANGILLILAVALILGDLSMIGNRGTLLSLALLLVIVFACGKHYAEIFLPQQGNQFRYQEIKTQVDTYTNADDVLVIFGSGWSSEMPYYLERRSLMLTDFPDPKYQLAVQNLSGYRVGGVLFCAPNRNYPANFKAQIFSDLHFTGQTLSLSDELCDSYYNVR